MRSFEQYDEICKYFAKGKNPNEIQKHLQLHNVSVGEYLTGRYALRLSFRMIDENELHGTCRRIENASEGITLQIEKKGESAEPLNAYILTPNCSPYHFHSFALYKNLLWSQQTLTTLLLSIE